MEAKHTPGPWDIHGDFREIHELSDEDGVRPIADVDPENVMPDQREANARLIAAAPDLLAALEQAQSALLDAAEGGEYWRENIPTDLNAIRAAIAKATNA